VSDIIETAAEGAKLGYRVRLLAGLCGEGVLDLSSGLCQLVFALDRPFDIGLRPTQGVSSGA
jgi:hypothetical protein